MAATITQRVEDYYLKELISISSDNFSLRFKNNSRLEFLCDFSRAATCGVRADIVVVEEGIFLNESFMVEVGRMMVQNVSKTGHLKPFGLYQIVKETCEAPIMRLKKEEIQERKESFWVYLKNFIMGNWE